MPVIRVDWLDGRDPSQKRELVAALTEVMHRIAGSPAEKINVVLNDVPAGNWGQGGKLLGNAAPPTVSASASGDAPRSIVTPTADLPMLSTPTRIFDLEQPRVQGMPVHENHEPGYLYVLYRRHEDALTNGPPGRRSSASGMIVCMEHSGTHIDALCHQADDQLLYGEIPADSVTSAKGFARHAIEEVPPLVARGVLLDIARHRGVDALERGEAITADELREACAALDVTVRPRDVVLIRTGNAAFWGDPERYLAGPGMDGGASRWLADQRVLAVGADNMAWDVIGRFDEGLGCHLPGHLILLAQSGIYIIENLDLEELGAAGIVTFAFVCAPLKFVGATGSPVRPIALVPA